MGKDAGNRRKSQENSRVIEIRYNCGKIRRRTTNGTKLNRNAYNRLNLKVKDVGWQTEEGRGRARKFAQ